MLTSLPRRIAFESSLKPPSIADDDEKDLQALVCEMVLFIGSHPSVEEVYIDWGKAYVIVHRDDVKDGQNAKETMEIVIERYHHMLQEACTSER